MTVSRQTCDARAGARACARTGCWASLALAGPRRCVCIPTRRVPICPPPCAQEPCPLEGLTRACGAHDILVAIRAWLMGLPTDGRACDGRGLRTSPVAGWCRPLQQLVGRHFSHGSLAFVVSFRLGADRLPGFCSLFPGSISLFTTIARLAQSTGRHRPTEGAHPQRCGTPSSAHGALRVPALQMLQSPRLCVLPRLFFGASRALERGRRYGLPLDGALSRRRPLR